MNAEEFDKELDELLKKDAIVLVAYKGGGYSGCCWEWNYAIIEPNKTYHNVGSTGYRACKYLEKLREADGLELFNLNDKESITSFVDTYTSGHIKGVAQYITEHFPNIEFTAKCPRCEEISDLSVIHLTGLHGCGGIAMAYSSWVCEDCSCNYSCSYCGEYCNENEEPLDSEGFCENCSKEYKNK